MPYESLQILRNDYVILSYGQMTHIDQIPEPYRSKLIQFESLENSKIFIGSCVVTHTLEVTQTVLL